MTGRNFALMNDPMSESGPGRCVRKLGLEECVKVIRRTYTASLLYAISEMLFTNNFILLYLAKLGVPSERILLVTIQVLCRHE